jgi:selenophosphate synthetase-related protein
MGKFIDYYAMPLEDLMALNKQEAEEAKRLLAKSKRLNKQVDGLKKAEKVTKVAKKVTSPGVLGRFMSIFKKDESEET